MTPLVEISRHLAGAVDDLSFSPPVTHIYNPLLYARTPHEVYLRRFARGQPEVLLLGMNPGPFGMAQTGVPFGDVVSVRDWLAIQEPVLSPARQHPRRPVQGFACRRREISGSRLWGWAGSRFGEPERFFRRFLVLNYCPLCFLEASGRNRTPDRLPAAERQSLFELCDRALASSVALLSPRIVVGIGGFAAARATEALDGTGVRVGRVLHPSPANPEANRGWAEAAEEQLAALGIEL